MISPIFSIFPRYSPIFSRNDRKNDRKRPRKWVIQLEVEERKGMKRNDFPRIFRENSTKFHEILRFSLFFHGYSIKFHRYSIKFRIFATVLVNNIY
jgi:hypothetical protein